MVVFNSDEELGVARRKWGKTEAKVRALVGRGTEGRNDAAEAKGKKATSKPAGGGFGRPTTHFPSDVSYQ